jgi:hypothetical protein
MTYPSILAERRAYWLTRLMSEQGYTPASLARAVWGDQPEHERRTRSGAQLLREWAKTGSQPRDAALELVSHVLGVCPSSFHTPVPGD